MVMKGLGIGLVVAGIIHTGIGIGEFTAYPHEVSLIGFASLLTGAVLYLGGAIEQFFEDRGRRGTRE